MRGSEKSISSDVIMGSIKLPPKERRGLICKKKHHNIHGGFVLLPLIKSNTSQGRDKLRIFVRLQVMNTGALMTVQDVLT
jgi:hypothetical protein